MERGSLEEINSRHTICSRATRAISAGCVDTEETLKLVADLESIGRNRAARAVSAGCVDTKDTLAIIAELKAAAKEM